MDVFISNRLLKSLHSHGARWVFLLADLIFFALVDYDFTPCELIIFLQHNHCIIMKWNMLMTLIGPLIVSVSPALSFLGGLCNQCRQSLREWRGN